MRTTLKTLSRALLCGVVALAGGVAQAAAIGNTVATEVILDNNAGTTTTTLATGTANLSTDPFDFGTNLGNSLGASDVYGDYVVTTSGATGVNGGTLYDIGIRIGSRETGSLGATRNSLPIVPQGTMLGGSDPVNQFTLSFGHGSGIAFDDVFSSSQVSIVSQSAGLFVIDSNLPPGYSFSSTGASSPPNAFVNPDGSVGLDITYDADGLLNPGLAGYISGNWATTNIGGIGVSLRVEVVPVPEPSTMALVSMACVGGLLVYRRRRA